MVKHLIIPDSHAKPGRSNESMTWAGRLALKYKPEVIVHLGDFFDMESLSSYDRGKKSFEGRRYNKDVEAGVKAMKAFNEPIEDYNKRKRANKEKQYRPKKVMLTGNHEDRINRAVQMSPELDGVLSLDNLQREKHGWKTYPFLQPVEIDGVHYSHYFISGVMGRPIGGESPAKSLLMKRFQSCTAGHTHVLDFAERTCIDGKKIMGLIAGCYFDGPESWAPEEVNRMWWKGLIMKHEVKNGQYDLETWSMERIKREFS